MAHCCKKLGFRLICRFRPFTSTFRRRQGLIPGGLQAGQVVCELIQLFFNCNNFPGCLMGIQRPFLVIASGQLADPACQIPDRRENRGQEMVDDQDGEQKQRHTNSSGCPEDVLATFRQDIRADTDLYCSQSQRAGTKAIVRFKPLRSALRPQFQRLLENFCLKNLIAFRVLLRIHRSLGNEANLLAQNIRYPNPARPAAAQGLRENLVQSRGIAGYNRVLQSRSQTVCQHLAAVRQVAAGILQPGRGEKHHKHEEHGNGGQSPKEQQLAG